MCVQENKIEWRKNERASMGVPRFYDDYRLGKPIILILAFFFLLFASLSAILLTHLPRSCRFFCLYTYSQVLLFYFSNFLFIFTSFLSLLKCFLCPFIFSSPPSALPLYTSSRKRKSCAEFREPRHVTFVCARTSCFAISFSFDLNETL